MSSVLITGGGGYLGTALTKRIIDLGLFERVCIYSRGEHRQAEMAQEFGNDPRLRLFIGDVRDLDRLKRAASSCDVVIHAAALKRIEVGFYNPDELVKTNVLGTMNVIEAARGCRKAVLVSTDKAFEPVSPYGFSKAMAESLFLSANEYHGTDYCVVRYGNVAGSTGSVIPAWRGPGPHWIAGYDITRFWMTLEHAVTFVLQAVDNAEGGELRVPDLVAYELGTLAEAMGVSPVLRSLGDYEKKHESMGKGKCSANAPLMTVYQLRDALENV